MADDLALRAQIRKELLHELTDLLGQGDAVKAGAAHLIVLTDYEVANLREAIRACGYASVYRSPLIVLQTGDWMGQIMHKLSGLAEGQWVCADAEVIARRANEWKD